MSLVLDVPIDRLATTLAPLRGPRTDASASLAPLPLRVAPAGDGTYEVLDGFKRLARWRREGHTHVPVVVEQDAGAGVVGKARLLEANTPRRTVSPMDEARVVRSLSDDASRVRSPWRPMLSARRFCSAWGNVARVLAVVAESRPSSKLAPYHALITEGRQQGLRSPRILREIRERGYTGGKTILKDFLKTLGPHHPPPPRAFHRFETRPGEEAQSDWSPYRVTITNRETIVHAFSLILCFSRRLFVAFFRNERLPTLLWAHQEAFLYHGGLCRRIAYDNQTAITLGRVGGKPRWHPTFLDFAKHYGFEPSVGRPGHKERRGKVERPFHYLEHDFLAGRSFASWDDLNQQCRQWLDTVANVRVHGTTRRRVDEAFAEEQPCLIARPSVDFPAARQETRTVQKDGYIPVDGSYYPVPEHLVKDGTVLVRIDPGHVKILDRAEKIVASHPVPEGPTRIPAPALPPGQQRAALSRSAQEVAFLARFPDASEFLDGLKHRMTTLTPIHLRAIDTLVDLYGAEPVQHALSRASAYRNFNSRAVERILQRQHPTVVPEPALGPCPLGPRPSARSTTPTPVLRTTTPSTPCRPPEELIMARKPEPQDALAQVRALLERLNLTTAARCLQELLAQAEGTHPAYSEFLRQILDAEQSSRWERKLQRRRRWSKLGPPLSLEGFDWAARPQLPPQVVKELLTCRFIDEHRNVILVGRPSTGKTTVAKALGHAACSHALSVYYAPTAEVLGTLHAARADGTYRKVFRRVANSDLLILDDAGFSDLGRDAANELFRVVCARYRQRSTIVVSNLPFKQWAEFLPSPAQAVAIADRLVDDATILRFSGKPYRQPRDVHGAPLDNE